MKVSEIITTEIWNHLRESAEDMTAEDNAAINAMQTAAVEFVKGYTGLTAEEIDTHEDITIAVLMIVADMYDNRQLQIDKNNLNHTADVILGLHSVNLL